MTPRLSYGCTIVSATVSPPLGSARSVASRGKSVRGDVRSPQSEPRGGRSDYTSPRDERDARITEDDDRDEGGENGTGTRRRRRRRRDMDVEEGLEQPSSSPPRRDGHSTRGDRWQAQSEQMRRGADMGRGGR